MAILYKMIYNELFNQITHGFYKVGDKLPSEKELSDLYNVSRITSKRALEELEKEKFVKRIRGKGTFLIKEIKPSEYSHKDISSDNKGIIAIIFPSVHNFGHFSLTVEAITKVISEKGYKPNLYYKFDNLTEVEELLIKLRDDKVKGVIYFPYSLLNSFEILNSYKYANIPIVTIDKYFQGLDIKAVCSDNVKGGILATEYLLELGHKNIGFISDVSIEGISSVRDRYFGYCQALEKANIPYNSNIININRYNSDFNRDYDESKYIPILKDLMEKGISAVIAINDIVASSIYEAAKTLNIRIPEDLSVVGFDGILFSEYQEIPLTAVLQDFTKMGRDAANIVIDEINGIHRNSIKTLPMSLVKRSSCSYFNK